MVTPDWVPEFPVATVVPAEGYEEVTDEVATGVVVDQEIVVLQELAPEAIVQEGVESVPVIREFNWSEIP